MTKTMEDFKEAVHFTNSGVGFQNIRISFREKHLRLLEKYESHKGYEITCQI